MSEEYDKSILTIDLIVDVVCRKYRTSTYRWNVYPQDLMTICKKRKYAYPRFMVMYIAKHFDIDNPKNTARYFNKDRTATNRAECQMKFQIMKYPVDKEIFIESIKEIKLILATKQLQNEQNHTTEYNTCLH